MVNSKPAANGCREWTRARFPNGYGKITVGSRTDGTRAIVGVHRVAYLEFVGPIPAGLGVLHSCDNRPCIEPTHFFLGTDLENAQDRDAKGRDGFSPGEVNGQAKLTAQEAMTIKLMAATGVKHRQLAAWFGVGRTAITRIVNGTRWGHLPEVG